MARVLVVAADAEIGARVQSVAEYNGNDVFWCGGPRRPTFLCAGATGERCTLTERADVVVVDMWLETDEARCGLPSWHLIRYYRNLGIPVLALVGPNGLPGPLTDDGVHAIARHADPSEMRQAIRDAIAGIHIRRRIPVLAAAGVGR
jgi:hypothetical protein